MNQATLRKLNDLSLHIRLAAMALENEEGVEVSDVNQYLDELDEILVEFEVGFPAETASESKQPDPYAAHSPECHLRRYREGFCDCELPKETKGDST